MASAPSKQIEGIHLMSDCRTTVASGTTLKNYALLNVTGQMVVGAVVGRERE